MISRTRWYLGWYLGTLRAPDKASIPHFFSKPFVVGARLNLLIETIQMSTNSIGFCGECIGKYLQKMFTLSVWSGPCMLWVLIWIVLMRRFNWVPTAYSFVENLWSISEKKVWSGALVAGLFLMVLGLGFRVKFNVQECPIFFFVKEEDTTFFHISQIQCRFGIQQCRSRSKSGCLR